MADDETYLYLYLNEGGFTPGMYEPHKAARAPETTETKRSHWRWIPGFDRERTPEQKSPAREERVSL